MSFQETLLQKLRQYTGQVAIEANGEQIAYEELIDSALAISQLILTQNLGPDKYVGVYLNDRVDIIKSMLGVMFAGGVFVPIDPRHPTTRTASIIEDTGLTCLITSDQTRGRLSVAENVAIVGLEGVTKPEGTVDFSGFSLEDSAYVYFTSGSTGKPKGIVGSYKGLQQFIEWETQTFEFSSKDRFAQFTTPYFDAFLRDIFSPLFSGATICVTPEEDTFFASESLASWINEQGITTIHCVPSLFYSINQAELSAEQFGSLKYILMSGEKIAPAQLKKWYDVFADRVRLVNFYGASESTMIRSFYEIKPEDATQVRIPVGKPIADTRFVVLDEALKEREEMAPGELYIVSDFLTKGYLNNEALTAEKFINLELDGQTYRAYKTGDEARLLTDGNIDLLGRKDRLVKVNGIRIELEAIDHVIQEQGFVKQAITVEHKDEHGNQTLKSFVITKGNAALKDATTQLKTTLATTLPAYMVPAEIIEVSQFPLLGNGKIDVTKLQEETADVSDGEAMSPIEAGVAEEWTRILGGKPVQLDKSFFLSGGNSLSFMNLIAALNKKYSLKLSLSQFFQNLTIEKQAKLIQKNTKELIVETPTAEKTNPVEAGVAEVWTKILGGKSVPHDKSFFLSGGNSLSFMNLIAALNKKYGLKLSLSQFFQNLTIEKQAQLIQKNTKADVTETNEVSIKPVQKEYYALTSTQRRLHFLHEFDQDSIAYNMPQFTLIEGALDLDRLKNAFQKLVDRHSIFRTSFLHVDEEVVQKVEQKLDFEVRVSKGTEAELSSLQRNFVRSFDLKKAPLLRVEVVQLDTGKSLLMTDVHHIISDGASTGLLVKDFMSFYEQQEPESLKIEYKDYAEWLQSEEQTRQLSSQKKFWLNEFAKPSKSLELPADHKRPKFLKGKGGAYNFTLTAEQTRQLKAVAAKHDTTLFITLLTAFNVFLSKLSGQNDIVIGTSVDGRRHADLKSVIGMFANTLPLRAIVDPKRSFSQFLTEVKDRTLKCFENQQFPFEDLVDKLNLERDTSRNPLFDIMFNYHSYERADLALGDLQWVPVPNEDLIAKFDLTLNAHEIINGEGIDLSFKYFAELFDMETIRVFADYFIALIDQITQNTELSIDTYSLLQEDALQQRVASLGEAIPVTVAPIQERLNASFEQYTENVAVEFQQKTFTYADLKTEADQIGGYLTDQGLKPQTVVGVLCHDKQKTISAVLGLLNTRMIFVPIDAELPAHRIGAMVDQVSCQHVLTDLDSEAFEALFGNTEVQRWSIADILKTSDLETSVTGAYKLEDDAYIYFTSGSTGQPKAIKGKNKGLAHFIDWETTTFGIDSNYKVSQFTTPSFDAYLRDILVPLSVGATICIPDSDILGSEDMTVNWLDENGINLIHCVPSFFKSFSENGDASKLASVKHVLLSGEQVLPFTLTNWYQTYGDRIMLTNLYGTTETTMVKAYGHITAADTQKHILAVKAIEGAQLVVLDENLAPCPPLVTGEIYIRTPYRTAGYIGNKAENDRVFIKNPHTDDKDDLLYKTGDLGRQDLQGEVQVLGRKDAQIKLNGIRIELSDIKENILQFPQINDAVVTVKEVQGVKTIGTYFRSESQIIEIDLIQFLAERLPRTMLPGFFMQVDEFPITSSGKTDVNALPLPENQVGDHAEPRTEQEATLLEIWRQVLDTKQISLHDNFFTVGGDSLKAIRIVSFLKKAGYELAIKDLFVYQNIALLAPQLVKTTEEVQITPVEKREYFPLSSGQRRQYMSHQMRENTLNFNMTISIEVPDTVGKSKVEEILNQLIQRHESLRTTYKNVNGEPVQVIHDRLAIEVEEIAIETFHTPGYNFSVPLELDQAPLIRGGLVLSEGTNLVLIDLHHINSDGLSNNILKEEFIALLNGENLAEQTLQYKDFAVWQNERNTPENTEKMASYWLDVFEEEISRTTWPVHHSETYGHIDRANSIAFELGTGLSQRLKDLAKEQGVSLFTLLLSIQNIVFQKLTSLEDLVIGFPSAGRNQTELERIVGVFINTIALRVYPKNTLSFRDFLSETAEHFNQALQYQDYPFDELIEQLNLPRNNNFNPLFNTIMVMQNHMDYGSVDIVSNEEGIVLETQGEVAENDLFIRCAEVQDRLILKYQYSTGVLLRQDLIQMFGYFKEVTEAILENEQIAIGDIQLSHDLGETHGELLEDAFSF